MSERSNANEQCGAAWGRARPNLCKWYNPRQTPNKLLNRGP
ncbi:MAG TPA: hypothetical protein VF814_06050 [Casimicrobiaceae bacterium]